MKQRSAQLHEILDFPTVMLGTAMEVIGRLVKHRLGQQLTFVIFYEPIVTCLNAYYVQPMIQNTTMFITMMSSREKHQILGRNERILCIFFLLC